MKIFTDYEKERLNELAEDLFLHGFINAIRPSFENEDIYDTTESWISSHYYYLRDIDCNVVHGATRIVVVCEDLPWVLKFNFEGKIIRQDYNLLEATNYKYACEEGIEEFFAATYCLGVFEDGVDVYAQEKVEIDEDAVSSSFFEYTLENYYCQVKEEDEDAINAAVWEESIGLDNEDRIYAMIDNFKDARRVWEFANKYDINDLHSGNWGYRGNEPVLIDYSGY